MVSVRCRRHIKGNQRNFAQGVAPHTSCGAFFYHWDAPNGKKGKNESVKHVLVEKLHEVT